LSVATDLLADGAFWFLLIVFVLASFEKILILSRHQAAWHPIFLGLRPVVRRFSRELLAMSAIMDLLCASLLFLHTTGGAPLATALIVVYSAVGLLARSSMSESGCRCLWKALEAKSVEGLMVRNLCLFLVATFPIVWGAPPFSVGGLMVGVVMLGAIEVAMRIADRDSFDRGEQTGPISGVRRVEIPEGRKGTW
jgi:hypothetical protein